MDDRKLVGKWWLPNNPDHQVGGILYIDSNEKCTVELTDSLLTYEINQELTWPEPIIHGIADGRFVTLLNTVWGEKRQFGPHGQTDSQTLSPKGAIIGIHLVSQEEKAFDGIQVEIDNLTAWSEESEIANRPSNGLSDVGLRPTYATSQKIASANVGGHIIDLIHIRQGPISLIRTLGRNEARETEITYAQISAEERSTWDSFSSTVRSLQDLMTLASRYPCAIRSKFLFQINNSDREEKFELLYPGNAEVKHEHKVTNWKFLFTLRSIAFEDLMTKWSSLREKVGLGMHVLFGQDYSRSIYFETNLFNAASTAEAFHRALFPDSTGLPRKQHKEIIESINSALPDNVQRDWVKGRLHNVPGYKERLLQLASIPDQTAVFYLLGDIDAWAKWMRDARNALAHMDSSKLNKIPAEARYCLSRLTSALIHLVLMQELEVPAKLQRYAAQHVYGSAAETFKAAVINS